MIPVEHTGCAQFEEALQKRAIVRTEEGLYAMFVEWSEVPPESVETLKKQMEDAKKSGKIPEGEEVKPFLIIGRCPFCLAPTVQA